MSEHLQSGHHPDADQLSAFVEHALPAHEREETLAHLAVCPDCRSIVALSLPPVEESLTPHPEPMRKPWFSGWKLTWPAAAVAALVAVIVAGVQIRNVYLIRNTPLHPQIASSYPLQPPGQIPASPTAKPQSAPAAELPLSHKHVAAIASAPPSAYSPMKNKAIAALPVDGRNPTQLARAAAGPPTAKGALSKSATGSAAGDSSAIVAGAFMNHPASSDVPQQSGSHERAAFAFVPSPGQSSTSVNVTTGGQTLQTENAPLAVINGIIALNNDQAQILLSEHPLPSSLPALSIVKNLSQILAIDAHNTLFLSNDAGGHWTAVPPPWQDRPVRIELISSATGNDAGNGIGAGVIAHLQSSPAAVGGPIPLNAAKQADSVLSGIITDSSGAIIPGASVNATDPRTGVSRATKSDPNGRYIVDQLSPGIYTVEAEAPGFAHREVAGITVNPAQHNKLNLALTVGSATETVTVATSTTSILNPTSPPVISLIPVFEITTDTGERWTSVDGLTWKRK
jgi:hypothetical protein